MPYRQHKSQARKTSMLGSQFVYMGVLSDDFAAVDVREELCYHSRPKKRKFKRCNERQKPMKESHARRKNGSRSPSGSAGTAPRRRAFGLVFRAVLVVFSVACAWLRRAQRAALVIDKHTPWCQLNKFCGLKQNDNYLKNFNYVKKQIFH